MTERDAFEVRFRTAVQAYVGRVSSDLDPVEFARRVAAREPRGHGFTAALGRHSAAIPRRAWVLLLLAGLLAALVGGMLIVGSQPVQRLPAVVPTVAPTVACPPGSAPDEPGPVDRARPRVSNGWAMAVDRHAGVLVALVGSVETWTFDVCTNTWTRMQPSLEPSGVDEWDLFVYDVDSDVTIAVDRHSGSVWAYDSQANTWTAKGHGPTDVRLGVYDPRSGLVVAVNNADPAELWTYDVETDAWTPIHPWNEARAGGFGGVAYDASVDRMVGYTMEIVDTAGTWLLDIRTGTWSRSKAETPSVAAWWTAPILTYDEAAERTLVFMRAPVTAYDATADRWEILAETETAWPSWMVYDPLNRRLVGIVDDGGVVAFDLVAGEWTVLLGTSR